MEREERTAVMGRVRAIGSAQHGVVLAAQLRSAGVTWRVRDRLLAEGWLVPVGPTAYSVGGTPSDWQRVVAAVLAAGPGAAVSHSSAARLHRIPLVVTGPVPEITVPLSRRPRIPGAVVHRSTSLSSGSGSGSGLAAEDTQTYRGLSVTTPARTLVDIARRFEADALAKIIDEGVVMRLWEPADVVAALQRAGRRVGSVTLRSLLEARLGGSGESLLEARAIRALEAFRPFEVHYQLVLDGRVVIVDMAWPASRVAVECDGWTVRSRSRNKFDHDRRRENLLVAHGWTVVHLTSAMSDDEMRAAVLRMLLRAASGG